MFWVSQSCLSSRVITWQFLMLSMNVWGNADSNQEPSEEPNTAVQRRLPGAEFNAKIMNMKVFFVIVLIKWCIDSMDQIQICGFSLLKKHGLIFFSCFLYDLKYILNKNMSFGVMKVYDCNLKWSKSYNIFSHNSSTEILQLFSSICCLLLLSSNYVFCFK